MRLESIQLRKLLKERPLSPCKCKTEGTPAAKAVQLLKEPYARLRPQFLSLIKHMFDLYLPFLLEHAILKVLFNET